MKQQIIDYRLTWNPHVNTGSAEFRVQGGTAPIIAPINNEAEFLVVAHLLEKSPIAYDPTTGWMMMEPRPVGK